MAGATYNLTGFQQKTIDLTNEPAFAAKLPAANFIGQLSVSSTTPMSALALGDDFGPFFSTTPLPAGHSGQLVIPQIFTRGGVCDMHPTVAGSYPSGVLAFGTELGRLASFTLTVLCS